MSQIRVFIDTKKRANEFAQYTAPDGTRYSQVPRNLLEWASVAEPPVGYSEDTHNRIELPDAPYVSYPEKTPEEQAAALAERARITADSAAMEYAKLHPVVQFLATHTPAECESYVETNVNDLAAAKTLLKQYAVALCVIARKEFRP